MQRGLSGKTRRGAPPLSRQRKALRVVQLTLVGVAVFLTMLTVDAYRDYQNPPSDEARQLEGARERELGDVLVPAVLAALFAAGALAMGLSMVRGPEPPAIQTRREPERP